MTTTTLNSGFGSASISLVPGPGTSLQAVAFGPGFDPADAVVTLTDRQDTFQIPQSGQSITLFRAEWTISFKNSSDVVTFTRGGSGELDDLGLLVRVSFANGTTWQAPQMLAMLRQADHSATFLEGSTGADSLVGNDRNLTLKGYKGNDVLLSGSGNETLDGGEGSDAYVFGAGWGHDVITVSTKDGDAIRFKANVHAADIRKERQGRDLLLTSKVDGSTLQVTDFFAPVLSAAVTPVKTISFEEGGTWTHLDLIQQLGIAATTPYADTIQGNYPNERLDGGAGADAVSGGAGADTLIGGEGSDTLAGEEGNDVLEGGAGRDVIKANQGDTVVFRPGFGSDRVEVNTEYKPVGEGYAYMSDPVTLSFVDGIKSTDVTIERPTSASQFRLVIRVNSTGDSLSLHGSYLTAANLENLTLSFSDGVQWTGASLAAHVVDTSTPGYDGFVDLTGNPPGHVKTVVLADGVRPEDVRIRMPSMDYRSPLDAVYPDDIRNSAPTYSYMTIDTGAIQGELRIGTPVPGPTPFSQVALQFSNGETWSPEELLRRARAGSDGADKLYAYKGQADTFSFQAGRGSDVIYNIDTAQDIVDIDTADVRFSVLEEKSEAGSDHYGGMHYNYATSILVTRGDTGETLQLFGLPMSGDASFIRLPGGVMLSGNELAGYKPGLGNTDNVLVGDAGDNSLLGLGGNDTLQGLAGQDKLYGGIGDDVLEGGEGQDDLYGGAGDDALSGGQGNDKLSGGPGDDTLSGGQGNDVVDGGGGANVFLFDKGDGKDTVTAADWSQPQTLRLGDGIKPGDLTLSISRGLSWEPKFWAVIGDGQRDVLQSLDVFDRIVFADGSILNRADIDRLGTQGTPLDDKMVGRDDAADVLYGQAGNDELSGQGGADTLSGGAGDDELYGGDGADRFDGGAGDDYIHPGFDNEVNVFVFGRKDGDDFVNGVRNDVIELKADIQPADVFVAWRTDGGTATMMLVIKGEASSIDLLGGSDMGLTVRFANGTEWTPAYLAEQKRHAIVWADEATVPSNNGDYLEATGWSTNDKIVAGSGDDVLRGKRGNDTLDGGAGADFLRGDEGDDALLGGDGNDTLDGGAGNDRHVAGSGRDLLTDTLGGSDHYEFGRLSGVDQIVDTGSAGDVDAIVFDAGIKASDIVVARFGDTLAGYGAGRQIQFQIKNTNTYIKVFTPTNSAMGDDWGIEEVRFADGTVWNEADIESHIPKPAGQNLVGTSAKDTLVGTAGDDTLTGNAGDDSLTGALGNDTLIGGQGNDGYLFRRGDGADTLIDNDATALNNDRLLFSDVGSRQLWLEHKGNDLVISVIGTQDKVKIQDWYLGSAQHVETITSGDGKTLTDARVDALVSAMAAFAPPAAGQTTLLASVDSALTTVLASSWR